MRGSERILRGFRSGGRYQAYEIGDIHKSCNEKSGERFNGFLMNLGIFAGIFMVLQFGSGEGLLKFSEKSPHITYE